MKTLSSLPDELLARVVEIQPGRLAPRLVEMGLYKGCIVRVLFRAPFNGPIAVDLGTYMLSLRMDEAALVLVEEEVEEA
jgi:Fe2+ transport system protein FeoA